MDAIKARRAPVATSRGDNRAWPPTPRPEDAPLKVLGGSWCMLGKVATAAGKCVIAATSSGLCMEPFGCDCASLSSCNEFSGDCGIEVDAFVITCNPVK
eukprot:1143607-Pleurochrysis_carterae.AAC.6